MSRIARVVMFVTALSSLFAVASSTAGAVTWHNTGGTSFHATGGPATLSRGGVNIGCSASTATGTAPGGTTVAQHYNVTGTITFNPCTFGAGQAVNIHCHYNFTNTTQPVAGVTAGSAGVTCVMRLTASNTALCHIEGSTPGTYTNPSGSTPGRVTISASSTLQVTNSTSACPLGTGSAALTEQTITITTAATSPVIRRTP